MDIVSMMKAKSDKPSLKKQDGQKPSDGGSGKSPENEERSSPVLGNERPVEPSDSGVPRWKIHGSHLVTRLPQAASLTNYLKPTIDTGKTNIRIAAFDMDDTLICTKSGIKFGRGPYDWKWRNNEILPVLGQKVKKENMILVIFTNQSSVSVTEQRANLSKSYKNLTEKLGLMIRSLEGKLGPIPVLFFASTGKPRKGVYPRSSDELHFSHRKPESGMWTELDRYIRRCLGQQFSIDLDGSYFVGDAAGRDGDHSAADSGFAENAGLKFYVPEDYFGM